MDRNIITRPDKYMYKELKASMKNPETAYQWRRKYVRENQSNEMFILQQIWELVGIMFLWLLMIKDLENLHQESVLISKVFLSLLSYLKMLLMEALQTSW